MVVISRRYIVRPLWMVDSKYSMDRLLHLDVAIWREFLPRTRGTVSFLVVAIRDEHVEGAPISDVSTTRDV
jgi:hypothetical protein